jgi:hypothetical protein
MPPNQAGTRAEAVRAAKQLDAEKVLETGDLPADLALRERRLVRRAREAPVTRRSLETRPGRQWTASCGA